MRTGDFVVQLEYVEQAVELEAENWRLCSATTGESCLAAESSLAAALAPLQLSHVSRPPGSLERLTNFGYCAYS